MFQSHLLCCETAQRLYFSKRSGFSSRQTSESHAQKTAARAVLRGVGAHFVGARVLGLVSDKLPAGAAVVGNLDPVTPVAFRRESELRLADRHNAFQVHAPPRIGIAVVRLPERGNIPVVGEATAVAGRF